MANQIIISIFILVLITNYDVNGDQAEDNKFIALLLTGKTVQNLSITDCNPIDLSEDMYLCLCKKPGFIETYGKIAASTITILQEHEILLASLVTASANLILYCDALDRGCRSNENGFGYSRGRCNSANPLSPDIPEPGRI